MPDTPLPMRAALTESVHHLEQLIFDDVSLSSGATRKLLRKFFFDSAEDETGEGSIAAALSMLIKQTSQDPLPAIVTLRCLAVDGLMPEASAQNHLARFIVDLCESRLPDLVTFIKLDKKAQTFEKFSALSHAHATIMQILNPLVTGYGDLDALVDNRKPIIGSLNHSVIRQYASPFRLKELRSTIEAILGKLKRVVVEARAAGRDAG